MQRRIEREILEASQVPLGSGTSAHTDHDGEGAVGMMLDATSDCDKPLTRESLLGWHRALFLIGYNMGRPTVGKWWDDAVDPCWS